MPTGDFVPIEGKYNKKKHPKPLSEDEKAILRLQNTKLLLKYVESQDFVGLNNVIGGVAKTDPNFIKQAAGHICDQLDTTKLEELNHKQLLAIVDINQKLDKSFKDQETKELNNRIDTYITYAIDPAIKGASIDGDLADVGMLAKIGMRDPLYIQGHPAIHDESAIINNAFNEHAFGSITPDNLEKFLYQKPTPSLGHNCGEKSLAREIIDMSIQFSEQKPGLLVRAVGLITEQNPINQDLPSSYDLADHLIKKHNIQEADITTKGDLDKEKLAKIIIEKGLQKEVKEFITNSDNSLNDHPLIKNIGDNPYVLVATMNLVDERAKQTTAFDLKDHLIAKAGKGVSEETSASINSVITNQLGAVSKEESYQKTLQNLDTNLSNDNKFLFDGIIKTKGLDRQKVMEELFTRNNDKPENLIKLADYGMELKEEHIKKIAETAVIRQELISNLTTHKQFPEIANKILKSETHISALNNEDAIESLLPHYKTGHSEKFVDKVFSSVKPKDRSAKIIELEGKYKDKSFSALADTILKNDHYVEGLDIESMNKLVPHYKGAEGQHSEVFLKKYLDHHINEYKKDTGIETIITNIGLAATTSKSNLLFTSDVAKKNIKNYIQNAKKQDKKWLSNRLGAIYHGTTTDKYKEIVKARELKKLTNVVIESLKHSGVSFDPKNSDSNLKPSAVVDSQHHSTNER